MRATPPPPTPAAVRPALATALAVALAAMTLALWPAPAGAQVPAPAPGPGLSPEVAAVPASSPELDAARRDLDALSSRLRREQEDLDRTAAELVTVDTDLAGTRGLLARRDAQIPKAEAGLARVREELRAIATEWFVSGFDQLESLDPSIDVERVADLQHQRMLARTATVGSVDQERFLARRLDALRSERDDLAGRETDLARRSATLAERRDRLSGSLERGAGQLAEAGRRVDLARLNADVDGTDMSTIALDAYFRAARTMATTDPACGVTWWALAGIGRTESRHGTYLGSEVGVDGRVSQPILGPPLDGTNGFSVVADSDGGALDGTATSDRAVGPMQFLPSSWKAVGRDGTGDGQADPQNLYDAALGAGAYLCRSGPVADEGGLRRAYFSYNRSQSYVDIVMQRANDYRAAVDLT